MGWQTNTLSDGFNALTFGSYILDGDYNGAGNYAAQFTLSADEQAIVRAGLQQLGVDWTPPPTPQGPPAPTPTPTPSATTNTAPTAQGSGPAPVQKAPAPVVSTSPTPPATKASPTTGVMPFIKDHKVLVSAALGGLIWAITKKPIAAVAVGGGTYLVTDKVIK